MSRFAFHQPSIDDCTGREPTVIMFSMQGAELKHALSCAVPPTRKRPAVRVNAAERSLSPQATMMKSP